MPTFLSIKEAAGRAEKAEITIRRFVQSIVKEQASSSQRKHIQPTPADVRTLKKQKRPFSWKISEELISQQFLHNSASQAVAKTQEKTKEDSALFSLLQSELEGKKEQMKVKDDQIQALTEIVHSLNERMREGNVLMASLQKHLALPAGTDALHLDRREGDSEKDEKQPKKTWIERLFG